MHTTKHFMSSANVARGILLAVLFAIATPLSAFAQGPARMTFDNPEAALAALAAAAKAQDRAAISRILGPQSAQLISGDAVRDRLALDVFSKLVAEKSVVDKSGDDKATFLVGELGWPFPIPVIEKGGDWHFDTEAGIEELISRRVGSNELSAITLCMAYALAQWDYFVSDDWDKDGVAEYAQLLRSSPGKRDGLYWRQVGDDQPSPLAGLAAQLASANYTVAEGGGSESQPIFGYRFKILTGQGPSATGGAHGYIANGNMISGFALVAYPVTYGSSGVMTFIVNQRGLVYQKDLGPNTVTTAWAMKTFNPDSTWKLAEVE